MTRKPDWTGAAGLEPAELDRLLAEDHDDVDDNPPATDAQLAAARPGRRGPGKRPAKVLLTMRVDPEILRAWEASGEGWRGRIGDLIAREAPKTRRA